MVSEYTARKTFNLLFAIVLFLLSASANPLNGQTTRQMNNVERRIETMNRQAKDFERDNMARDGKAKTDPETAKRTRQIRLEIEEDLNKLQDAYNGIVTVLNSGREISPDFASETTVGIRKNAVRLKANLALPVAEDGDGKATKSVIPEGERETLTALCKSIYDLIINPVFENGNGLDMKHASNARVDLEMIIILTEYLSKRLHGTPTTDPVD